MLVPKNLLKNIFRSSHTRVWTLQNLVLFHTLTQCSSLSGRGFSYLQFWCMQIHHKGGDFRDEEHLHLHHQLQGAGGEDDRQGGHLRVCQGEPNRRGKRDFQARCQFFSFYSHKSYINDFSIKGLETVNRLQFASLWHLEATF